MRITTKAIFEWDKDTSRYIEVYAEGYDYQGELDTLQSSYSTISGIDPPSPSTRTMPTAWDFANKSMEDIMKDMGYSDIEVSEYSEYVPRYDPWKVEYAEETAGVERAGVALGVQGLREQQKLTTGLYGLSQEGLAGGLQSVSRGGEKAMYDIFQQGNVLAAGGLGERSNLMKRDKSYAMSTAEEQSERLRLQGLEKTYGYESAMKDLGLKIEERGLDVKMIDIEEQRGIKQSVADYERQFWSFLTQLQLEHGVDFMDDE